MSVSVHQLRSGGVLDSLANAIDSAMVRVRSEVYPLLELPDVDLVLHTGRRVIPEFGLSGYSTGAHQAFIAMDPASPNLVRDFEQNFVATVGHELHHCARSSKGKSGRTLWDMLIFEGLACHFELELRGKPPFYATLLSEDEQLELVPRVRAEAGRTDFDYFAWFYGSKERGLPRCAGYSLGFTIADRYVRASGRPASKLIDVDAAAFRSVV